MSAAIEETYFQSDIVLSTLICCLVVLVWYWSIKRPSIDFPPGPRPLPLIGNLLDFSSQPPHVVFLNLASKYGDIFSVKIGQRWTVVLNSIEITREALLKQPVNFAGRPDLYSFQLLSGGGQGIALSDFSSSWAYYRKLTHTNLRNLITGDNNKFEKFILGFTPELERVLNETQGKPFDPKTIIGQLVYSILGKICFGESYCFDDPILLRKLDVGRKFLSLLGNGLFVDFFPSLWWLPLKRAKNMKKIMEKLIENIRLQVVAHKGTLIPGKARDFIDLMLESQLTANSNGEKLLSDYAIALSVSDIHGGGTDTTAVTLYWTLALMVEYPHVQDKIASLADEVIGRERLPTLADRNKLPYIVATVYEVLRYSTKLPLSVPHSTTQDTRLGGYFIPKDTMIMTNIWAMHRNEANWEAPYSFKPEHFLDKTGTVRQHPTGFLPFSTGRRVCIGESMVKSELFLLFTWLFQHYKFSKVPGTENQSYIEHGQILVANEVNKYQIIAQKRF